MAKSEKILAYVSTLQKFEAALEIFGSDYYDNSVVFIEDTQQIYTHGTYFDGGGINWQELKDGVLTKGEERFNIWYCSQSDFESYSDITSNILSIVNYIVTCGEGALGAQPGTQFNGKRLYKGQEQIRLIMDEMLLENEIELGNNIKIVPDTLPGIIKQLFKLLKYTPTEGGDEYWNELGGPVTPDEPESNDITWGDVDEPESAQTNTPQAWAPVSSSVSPASSSFWEKLFRLEQK